MFLSKRSIPKPVSLLFFSLLFFAFTSHAIAQRNHLADSIQNLIHFSPGDSTSLESIFELIIQSRGNLSEAYLPLLYDYVKQSSEYNYTKGVMRAYDRIGLQYRYDERYDSAIYYHNKSLDLASALEDSVQLYYNFNNLGQVYRRQDLNGLAIRYLHQALAISEAIGDKRSTSFTLNSLGASYVVQKEYDLAMHYFQQSIEIAESRNDIKTLAYNYGAIGEVFLELHKPDSAMYYFKEAKRLKLETKRQKGLSVSNHLIARAYFDMGNYTDSEKYFDMAIPAHKEENNARYLAFCYAYKGMIKTLNSSFDSAYYFLNTAEELAVSKHSFEMLVLIHRAKFELNRKTERWEEAISSLQAGEAYSDSILNMANALNIQTLEIEYNTQRREERIKLLSAENQINKQQLRFVIILAVLLLLAIALGIYVQFIRRKQARYERDELKQQLMKSQMNPHFLFNALGSIQGFMYKNETKKAAGYLGNFASLTRSILENSAEEFIPLVKEISTLQNYIELEKMRMGNRFEYSIEMDDEVDAEFIEVPPMLLQPFVENAIKHGLRDIEAGGLLKLIFRDVETYIEVQIIDNGKGIESTRSNKSASHKSMATAIFSQRMQMLQRRFTQLPEPTFSDLKDEGGKGTKVRVYLPVKPI